MIKRLVEKNIISKIGKGKAIILLGPRQVGKTTLLKNIAAATDHVLWLNGDEVDVQAIFENTTSDRLKAIIGNHKLLMIDEAQRISNIGIRLKLITDQLPEVQLIASGSWSFELANHLNEPLTGRKWEYKMYPLSFQEMVNHHGLLQETRMIPHRLLYGYYPDIVNNQGEEKALLKQLSDSYLYKDILLLDQINKPENMVKLLTALAFQIGSQVSYNELSKLCGLDAKTVEKYIDLLEKAFIIFRLSSYSRNLRSELKRSKKIYFYDNGIRNALIANFNQIENRTDVGALWENFLMAERIKKNAYNGNWVNSWYWRTIEQQEIDYIEEFDGNMRAYEFKWNAKSKIKIPNSFKTNYPDAQFTVVHQQNFEEFLL